MTCPLMTYAETADYLRVPLATLYSMVSRKKIPHVRLSTRTVRFPRDKVDAWVKARTFIPNARDTGDGDDHP